jgi:hypothetical protein
MPGSAIFAKKIPYITNATLLPTNIVDIYCPGLRVKIDIIPDELDCCFRSNSIFSLFADTKAISIPEKKAEKIRETKIIIK